MRADRLVATLLLLQAKGKITASELADELEVSVRTARRDLESLAMSGVPVYSQPGRGGGWALLGGARTDLTGLTAPEVHALFLAVGASATASPALKAAVNKLAQALPETFRSEAAAASEAAIIDPAGWGRPRATKESPFLATLQESLATQRQVLLGYDGARKAASIRTVHPLGLVTKAGVWYLVASNDSTSKADRGPATDQRTFRLDRVTSAQILEKSSKRPDNFDLGAAWSAITDKVEEIKNSVAIEATAQPWTLAPLRHLLGSRLKVGEPCDGHFRVRILGLSPRVVAGELAGFGAAIEILSPESVRLELARVGEELNLIYGEQVTPSPQPS